MFDLTDQVALVTGATGGIGRAIVKQLLAQGAHVLASGTRQEALQEALEELQESYGERITIIKSSLQEKDACEKLIADCEAQKGRLDILVNNAGIARDDLVLRMSLESWQDVLDVNLTSAFRLIRASAKGMIKRRYGRIITISSVVGVTGNPGQANYVASKAGLIGMSKALALELATRHITVNCIAPGFIISPMTEQLTEAQRDAILGRIPCRRLGMPEDVGAGVVYLASREASYVTGQTLHINGGMAMV